ncbi:nicotinate-nucleotide adenylyltransferase [Alkalicoccus luteus]|uniref:Probable nicotinate-nucleotide adenylyltransferase n=1 Tax=Alkalicoccus luteus TaxID=1237094 RepID=A0A969TSF3_9BACI|nr:nicotinate-nucleotide adenylyltransferase [Alkalicoccus luteus]NJP36518.1 nicotinate (nicotinamide) nucleotide adenylyltransferase [Alkalicoccus luteus]
MKHIGILGGTFDPPHIGHVIMAEEARIQFDLDEIWWMPNRIPPHKKMTSTPEQLRIKMVKSVVQLSDSYRLCLKEMEREGPSYTSETVTRLIDDFPAYNFSFIMGGDSLAGFHKWNDFEKLQKNLSFIVMNRPGGPDPRVNLQEFTKLSFIEGVEMTISSTSIRSKRKSGAWNAFLVPEGVDSVIKEYGLYETD